MVSEFFSESLKSTSANGITHLPLCLSAKLFKWAMYLGPRHDLRSTPNVGGQPKVIVKSCAFVFAASFTSVTGSLLLDPF